MRMAIYCRVSTIDQNPENQEIQLVKYAELQGWQFEVFQEKESTRKTRPIKQQLMQDLRSRKFDGVLIWKLDRWARSLKELITDIDELISKKLEFVVMTTPIDTTTAGGRLFIQMMGAFAEFEREINRERTMLGLARARAKGVKLGRPKKIKRFMVNNDGSGVALK